MWFVLCQLSEYLIAKFVQGEDMTIKNLAPKCPPATIAFKTSGLPPPNLEVKDDY